MKVLVLGGYGTFGSRLVRLLADEPRLSFIVAGRSLDAAQAFCRSVTVRGGIEAAVVDRNGALEDAFRALKPDVVVDCSGPFQAYGGDPYRVVRACLALGIAYLDLADGSAFVEGIAQFDAAAKARGVVVLSGASTFPVLSTAVVRALSAGWRRVRDVVVALAPSPHIDLGRSVIGAIASYAGKPVRLWRGGRSATGAGMIEARRFTVGAPGMLPLVSRRFALADVPDLRLAPALYPGLESIWMGVGTLPAITHRMLSALACLVRLRLLPSLGFLAPLFHATSRVVRWGEARGGMAVLVRGDDADGMAAERPWHVIAEGDTGPFIPAMAAAALLRKMLDGPRPAAGARSAAEDVTLDDYAPWFAAKAIRTGTATVPAAALPLYRRFFSDAWDALPAPVRALHDGGTLARGRADIERGRGLLARLAAAIIGFPPAGSDVPVAVSFAAKDGRETWTRDFGGRRFSSVQFIGTGRSAGLICERFGPLTFGLAMVIDGERLRLVTRRWSAFGVPMPGFLKPRGAAFESVDAAGRFCFHVEIGFPWTGLIVRYRGWLEPAA